MYRNLFGKTLQGTGIAGCLLIGTVFSVLFFTATKSRAQDCEALGGYSCTYEIEKTDLQKVPPFFKFQTRISQAKLPVGDVIFDKIFVNVKRGETSLCQETFSQVPVRDSVLNLELGRTMDCELGTIIANNDDLKFQICIGNQENCLKPVSLSSVPFAIKSSYANLASKADKANEAVQCHYAHRVTADRELFTSQKIGMGFYDFYTPAPSEIDNLINLYDETAMSMDYYTGGYVQWMQLDPTSTNLHICGQYPDSANNQPVPLDELVFHAVKTQAFGSMVVKGDPAYTHEGDQGTLDQQRSLFVQRGMTTVGKAYFNDDVIMSNATENDDRIFQYNHTLIGDGVSNFRNTVNVGQNALTSVDENEYESVVQSNPGQVMNVNHWMRVYGNSQFFANANFYANATFAGPAVYTSANTRLDVSGEAVFHNRATVEGPLIAQQSLTSNNISVFNGISDFYDTSTFHSDAVFNDDVYFNGPVHLPADVFQSGDTLMRSLIVNPDHDPSVSDAIVTWGSNAGISASSDDGFAVVGNASGAGATIYANNWGTGSGIDVWNSNVQPTILAANEGVGSVISASSYNSDTTNPTIAANANGNGAVINASGWGAGDGIFAETNGTAIRAVSWEGFAIDARSNNGSPGIYSTSDGTAIWAESNNGFALDARSYGENTTIVASNEGVGGVIDARSYGGGVGIYSYSEGTTVWAESGIGWAIDARSYGENSAIIASNNDRGSGIEGYATNGYAGVYGEGWDNGVVGIGSEGAGGRFESPNYGVYAISPYGTGVIARSDGGVGLTADGYYVGIMASAAGGPAAILEHPDNYASINIGGASYTFNSQGRDPGDLWIETWGSGSGTVVRLCYKNTGNSKGCTNLSIETW